MENPTFNQKRQFGRIKIHKNTLCEIHIPQAEKIIVYRGCIKNISLGGIFFVCDEKPPLEKNDIRHLIFLVLHNCQKTYQLNFHALVVRTEKFSDQFGVALKFLSDPMYCFLEQVEDSNSPLLDKTRVMYQNYLLCKKSDEIIRQTPDIRTEKIKNIKKLLDQDAYQIDLTELANSITVHFKRS
jgi:PilZ domain/Anti-sigma-28 factor, FlgM